MKRLRWYLLPALALLASGTMATLVRGHGYPRAVYFYRYEEDLPAPQGMLHLADDTWVDPSQRVVRIAAHNAGASPALHVDEIVRGGAVYDLDAPRASRKQPLPPVQAQRYRWVEQQLQRGGFTALAQDLLAHATGPLAHTALYGHQAVRFATNTPYSPGAPGIAWLDAQTHALLQIQWFIGIDSHTEHFVQQRRLAPGAVAGDFFDPAPSAHSFLGQLLDWLPGRAG